MQSEEVLQILYVKHLKNSFKLQFEFIADLTGAFSIHIYIVTWCIFPTLPY